MRLNINIKKSIETGKLVSNSYYHKFIDGLNSIFFSIAFTIIIIAPTIGEKIEITVFKIVMIAFILLIAILSNLLTRRMSKLVLIDNSKGNFERNNIHKLAEDSNWPIVKEDENMIVLRADNGFSNERQISFLLKNNCLYVNVLSFGMYDIKSPIYFKGDQQVLKRIIKEITLHKK